MQCKLCREREKTYVGSIPQCAFNVDNTGTFNSDNWNCATMNALREKAAELKTNYRDDQAAGSIGYVPYEDFDGELSNGYIVMTWYKERGKTDMAFLVSTDDEIEQLTEQMALDALDYSKYFVRDDEEGNE